MEISQRTRTRSPTRLVLPAAAYELLHAVLDAHTLLFQHVYKHGCGSDEQMDEQARFERRFVAKLRWPNGKRFRYRKLCDAGWNTDGRNLTLETYDYECNETTYVVIPAATGWDTAGFGL